MRQMHPAPRHPIVAPDDLGPGLNASDGAVAAALTHLFKTDYTSMDFSGWSMSLLRPVKGRPDVMDPIIGLIRAIANCDMPLEVYWLITVGSLVALHKLDVNAQAVLALAGLDPKLRPVNKSALLWKCATQVAIGHAEYDRACKLMQPAERNDGLAPAPRARAPVSSAVIKHGPQLGLGAKLGMPRMAFTAQELYAEGYSIGECDGANAFHEASRQKMLEAVRRECPHMTRLFWMGYCSHSPLVLMRLGKSFAVLHSQEGARMGDKFGSFVYCLTVHPAYIEIMERCPSVVVQAATDDLKGYARDPLDLCRMLPIAAEALERHAGVKLNVDKSAILLPRGVSDPDATRLPPGAVVRDGYLLMPLGVEQREHKIELKRDGTIVVGAAVGTDAFVMHHIRSVVDQAVTKFSALRIVQAQNALLLLSGCLSAALGYILQVTPPRLALAAAQAWDAAMDAERARIASDPELGVTPTVGADLQAMSDGRARLPLRMNGLGHTSAVMLSPIAFYAAYTQHVYYEPDSRGRLLLGELNHARNDLDLLLPPAGVELLTAPGDMGLEKPVPKLQRSITRAAQGLALDRLNDFARDDLDKRVINNPTDAFLPFLVAPTSHDLVIDHKAYISGLRFFLLLPQLLRTPRYETVDRPAPGARDFSYQADACHHCRGHFCDRHLVHAHACKKSSKPKLRDRHDMVKLVRTDLVNEAGYADVRVEPRLRDLAAAPAPSQRRGDVFFVDDSRHVHFHYLTDDVIVHPLSPTFMDSGELDNPRHAMDQASKKKKALYTQALDMLRSAQACVSGLRKVVFRPCGFTSLGALSKDSVKFINGAAGLLKFRASAAQARRPRDDGLTPQQLAKQFRFSARARIQAAILKGNSLIASAVGL